MTRAVSNAKKNERQRKRQRQKRQRQRRQSKRQAETSAWQLRRFSNSIHYAASAGCKAVRHVFHLKRLPIWVCQAAEVTRAALAEKLAYRRRGDAKSPLGVLEAIRPNIEAELERLAHAKAVQDEVSLFSGYKVGDAVQHKFVSGLIGTVIGFTSDRMVRVKWENCEQEGQCSQIGSAGLVRFQHVYPVTLHATREGPDQFRIACTNMAGENIATLDLHPRQEVADLFLQLQKLTPTRSPGMPMRTWQPLLPDGTRVCESEAGRSIADILPDI